MPHNHDEEILFLGPAGRGGMRSVIDAYATVFDPFKIIFTQKEGSTAKKIMVGIASMSVSYTHLTLPTNSRV